MDHFPVVQSICRLGLASGDPAIRKQVERLRVRLEKDGEVDAAGTLARLLAADERSTKMAPSRIELSRSGGGGERLTEATLPPFDKESSAPLAEIVLEPGKNRPSPVHSAELGTAIAYLLDEWLHLEELTEMGVAPSRSLLLFGLPGTGKTLTAFAIAARLGLPVVVARLDGLMSSFLGTTARNIGSLFDFANRYRCVLLLDEFDAVAKLRDDPQEVGEIKRVVNTLLQSLDQRASRGVTIAITNHPSLLDPAIWRRFEVKIEMPLPTPEERGILISNFLTPLRVDDAALQVFAWLAEGATGAEIEGMVHAVKRRFVLAHRSLNAEALSAQELVESLRAYALTSASLAARPRFEALQQGEKLFAKALLADETHKFTQSAVAAIFGKDQATISRWGREELTA